MEFPGQETQSDDCDEKLTEIQWEDCDGFLSEIHWEDCDGILSETQSDDLDEKLSFVGRETGKRPMEVGTTSDDEEEDDVPYKTVHLYLPRDQKLKRNTDPKKMDSCVIVHDKSYDDESWLGHTLMYDHKEPNKYPERLRDSLHLCNLAIDCYNLQNKTNFCMVEVLRAITEVVAGISWHLKFTAKQNGVDATTFAAQVFEPIRQEPVVDSVNIVTGCASLPVDTLDAIYDPW